MIIVTVSISTCKVKKEHFHISVSFQGLSPEKAKEILADKGPNYGDTTQVNMEFLLPFSGP